MTSEILHTKAIVFDLDDTLLDRGLFPRLVGLVIGKLRQSPLPNLTLDNIAQMILDHNSASIPVSNLLEKASFVFHSGRRAYPGIKTLFQVMAAGADIYGNTGRPNKAEWVDMTYQTLQREGLAGYFKGVFFTPDGTRTAVSKAHALLKLTERYEKVEFYDDDPRTARFIAKLFPNITVYLVQHKSTALLVSTRELEELPNLKRVPVMTKQMIGCGNDTLKRLII